MPPQLSQLSKLGKGQVEVLPLFLQQLFGDVDWVAVVALLQRVEYFHFCTSDSRLYSIVFHIPGTHEQVSGELVLACFDVIAMDYLGGIEASPTVSVCFPLGELLSPAHK